MSTTEFPDLPTAPNEPAYPVQVTEAGHYPGLTKREYIATQMMAALLVNNQVRTGRRGNFGVAEYQSLASDRDLATNALAAADALLDRLNTLR